MPKKIDLTGERFGRLVVVCQEKYARNNYIWLCICDCGNLTSATTSILRAGNKKSCGCLNLAPRKGGGRPITHNLSGTQVYNAWIHMWDRCINPACWNYYNYGGRGIRVCSRWAQFDNFLADMGHPPGPGLSLDRIDPSGNYEPGNCRWATALEQRHNRRKK